MKIIKHILVLTLAILPLSSFGLTPEEKGLQITTEMDRRDIGWVSMEADSTMILRNAYGEEDTRYMRTNALEVQGDGDKSLTIFDHPKDIKGTAFLTFSHTTGPDDQWLYLPAIKRVKRISTKNKSGPFMGSEFSYEDLSPNEVSKYTYKFLREEKYNGVDCFVVESYPVDKYSGYTRLINWIDKEGYRIQKIVFYDRKNTLLKTLLFKSYNQYLNKYWRADQMLAENHQNGKSTEINWSNYQFQTGLNEKDFTKNSLKRAK